jgi:hypothetical protein
VCGGGDEREIEIEFSTLVIAEKLLQYFLFSLSVLPLFRRPRDKRASEREEMDERKFLLVGLKNGEIFIMNCYYYLLLALGCRQ